MPDVVRGDPGWTELMSEVYDTRSLPYPQK